MPGHNFSPKVGNTNSHPAGMHSAGGLRGPKGLGHQPERHDFREHAPVFNNPRGERVHGMPHHAGRHDRIEERHHAGERRFHDYPLLFERGGHHRYEELGRHRPRMSGPSRGEAPRGGGQQQPQSNSQWQQELQQLQQQLQQKGIQAQFSFGGNGQAPNLQGLDQQTASQVQKVIQDAKAAGVNLSFTIQQSNGSAGGQQQQAQQKSGGGGGGLGGILSAGLSILGGIGL